MSLPRPRPASTARQHRPGAAFGLADALRPEPEVMSEREAAEAFRDALAEHGFHTEIATLRHGLELRGTGENAGARLGLESVMRDLRRAEPEEWEEVFRVHARQRVAGLQALRPPASAEEWRRVIRTRLIGIDHAVPGMEPVSRPFAGDLLLALYRRFDGGVAPVLEGDAEACPLSVDELYALGQANTNADPLVHAGPIGGGAWALHGEGFSTASKAADLPDLLGTIDVDVSGGVLFAVPHKHALGLHPVDLADPELALRSMVLFVIEETMEGIDAMLSPCVFHRAPDGFIEAVALPRRELDGSMTVVLLPGTRFEEMLVASTGEGSGGWDEEWETEW